MITIDPKHFSYLKSLSKYPDSMNLKEDSLISIKSSEHKFVAYGHNFPHSFNNIFKVESFLTLLYTGTSGQISTANIDTVNKR